MEQIIKNVLLTIKDIDKNLSANKKEKNKITSSCNKRIKLCKVLNIFLNYKFTFPFTLILSIINYLFFENKVISVFTTLGIVFVFNLIVVSIVNKFELKKHDLSKIQELRLEQSELISKRKTYISIYNYLLKGDKFIFNNIRLKVNNESFYKYDDYIKELWLENDSFAHSTILEMKDKEEKMINNIKNTIYYEINSPTKKEGLSLDQLMKIKNAL